MEEAGNQSTAELWLNLECELSKYFKAERRIVKLYRHPSSYRSSFLIEEIEVHLDDGTVLQLMFKDLSCGVFSERVRRAKPVFLYDPMREIEAYQVVLASSPVGAATCYGAVVEHQANRYWLFIERVDGRELYQTGEFAAWQQAARWLAAMHDHFAQQKQALAKSAHLIKYDYGFYQLWMQRARNFLAKAESAGRSIEWLAARYDKVIECIVKLPVVFIHGEFYASNIIVQETTHGWRVCPIDWEMAALGPGLIDLAALIAGNWTEEEKIELALAYYGAASEDGRPSLDSFLNALAYCKLHIAVQWLGWFGRRRQFAQHEQDWLGEALCLAEKLKL
jgi:aminoglycoside phosphotransferase (APT) family kinase protein